MDYNSKYTVLNSQERWKSIDKDIIADKIKKYIKNQYPECDTLTEIIQKLADLTGSNYHAAYAWINRSRRNVKIPFLKLCILAQALNMDVEDFI